MDNLNVICPVTHSAELNNISEYNPDTGLSLANEDLDLKAELEEIINDLYAEVEKETELDADSPEIVFSKYLWIIKLKVQALEKVKASAEKLIQDIEAWAKRKSEQHQGQIEFLSARMEGYLRLKQLKSLNLPSGVIGLRMMQPKIEIVDLDKFYGLAPVDLLRHIPEAYEADMKKIREHIKTTGEIPVGADLIEQDSKFYYKLN